MAGSFSVWVGDNQQQPPKLELMIPDLSVAGVMSSIVHVSQRSISANDVCEPEATPRSQKHIMTSFTPIQPMICPSHPKAKQGLELTKLTEGSTHFGFYWMFPFFGTPPQNKVGSSIGGDHKTAYLQKKTALDD